MFGQLIDLPMLQRFALSPVELGSLISIGPTESCEFFHDPSMKTRFFCSFHPVCLELPMLLDWMRKPLYYLEMLHFGRSGTIILPSLFFLPMQSLLKCAFFLFLKQKFSTWARSTLYYSLAGQVRKTLQVSPLSDDGGYYFNLSMPSTWS